jgi:glycine cleavage system H protein
VNVPSDLKYSEEHEWIKKEDGVVVIGITDYAQSELGDVIYVELPEIGKELSAMDVFGTIEAVKTVSDLYCPVAGKVAEVNLELEKQPELVNSDPYGKGWMVRVALTDPADLDKLMNASAYEKLIEGK